MKPIIKITLTAADFATARQCPWSGKTCLIAQAAKRTFDEHVVASSWSCVDTITRDFEYLHGYTFHDETVTRLMALFDRGHQEDIQEVTAGLPYTFVAKLTCSTSSNQRRASITARCSPRRPTFPGRCHPCASLTRNWSRVCSSQGDDGAG